VEPVLVELVEYKMSEEIDEKHLDNESVESESAIEWLFKATRDGGTMGN
jgi:hypothetical protein